MSEIKKKNNLQSGNDLLDININKMYFYILLQQKKILVFMSFLKQINEWSSKHNPKWLVVIRVALGLCLFVKGFGFIKNTAVLEEYISSTSLLANASWLTTLIPWVHLLGGSMIIAGLFTRLGSLLNIPILIGAVFFVNAKKGVFAGESDLLFSIIILLLLFFFLLEGGGPLSLDNYFSKSDKNENP